MGKATDSLLPANGAKVARYRGQDGGKWAALTGGMPPHLQPIEQQRASASYSSLALWGAADNGGGEH